MRETMSVGRGAIRDVILNYLERFPGVVFVAHNAYFEQVITRNVLRIPDLEPKRWICTASLAASLALPRNLEGAANAMNLESKKDMDGNRLIKKWCRPRKPTKNNPKTRHDDPVELSRIIDYCKRDVETTTELFLKLPMLTPTERKVWLLDQKINLRGFAIDRPLVETALKLIDEETRVVNQKTDELTFGLLTSATQRDGVLRFLEDEKVFLPDLRKKTVDDALKNGLVEGAAKEILEYRQTVSKTSTAKYQAFEMRSRSDGRVRDILMYHGASTGRWGGVGVQPQNLPRPTIYDTDQAAEILKTGDLELVRMIYGNPMETLSSCIRSIIVAPPGRTLDVADYNAIEARVLFWVAGHQAGLRAFEEGRDLYKEQASRIYGVPLEKIDSDKRWLGKTAVLGCGYSMGPKKFREACLAQGRDITENLAEAAVRAYREAHAPVVKLWDNIGRAAVAAVDNVGKKYTINRTTWFVRNGFLWCELPSGRRLAYASPVVKYEPTPWGDKRPVLYHYGTDIARKWVETKTYGGKLVENVVQAIARDLMAEAMLRIETAGPWAIVLSVHDELIAERDLKAKVTNSDFCQLMADLPTWAAGCPVVATGWAGIRYRK